MALFEPVSVFTGKQPEPRKTMEMAIIALFNVMFKRIAEN
jgi:hypothetical protein